MKALPENKDKQEDGGIGANVRRQHFVVCHSGVLAPARDGDPGSGSPSPRRKPGSRIRIHATAGMTVPAKLVRVRTEEGTAGIRHPDENRAPVWIPASAGITNKRRGTDLLR